MLIPSTNILLLLQRKANRYRYKMKEKQKEKEKSAVFSYLLYKFKRLCYTFFIKASL